MNMFFSETLIGREILLPLEQVSHIYHRTTSFLLIIKTSYFHVTAEGAGKKGAKKKGGSFQTVSALFRVGITNSCLNTK